MRDIERTPIDHAPLAPASIARVCLYWLPLGAGGHVVRWNGRVYEAFAAWRQQRPRLALFHAAMTVQLVGTTYAVEMGPVWNVTSADRGVVCEGPVGARLLGRIRWFRYEVRCWQDGVIPDLDAAVDSPVVVSEDQRSATTILDALRRVPALTWGRDELGLGEMWNSNSLIAWLLASGGIDPAGVRPPEGGRAPGWGAGVRAAQRQHAAR